MIAGNQMRVRRLGAEDVELAMQAICALKMSAARNSFGPQNLGKFLSRPENVLIVADDQGVPAGFLIAYMLDRIDRDQKMVCLYETGVAESHRRRGIGKAMIEALKALCKVEGVMKTWVVTDRSNVAAARLYESTGARGSGGDDCVFVYEQDDRRT